MRKIYQATYLAGFLFLTLNGYTLNGHTLADYPPGDKSTTVDTDGDGIVDACDADSDNDGIPDVWEDQNSNGIFGDNDFEGNILYTLNLGDGIANYLDLDSDNDAVLDLFESGISLSLINQYDPDQDGILNGPVGTNGLLDALETFPDSGIPIYTLRDTNSDGIPDYLDLASDNNQFDLAYVHPELMNVMPANQYGFLSPTTDEDQDGIQAPVDTDPAVRGAPNSPLSPNTVDYDMVASTTSLNFVCDAMPVRVIQFNASRQEEAIRLNWEIADASNFANFDIERSTNATRFESIGRVAYINGQQFYQLIDNQPKTETIYYRLKLNDLDGTFAYSRIVALGADKNSPNWQFSPNPTTGLLRLSGLQPNSRIELVNIQGRNPIQLGITQETTAEFDLSRHPAGLYLLRITSPNGQINTKRVLLKK